MAVLFIVLCSDILCRLILVRAKLLGPTSKSSVVCALGPSLSLCCAVIFICRFILAKAKVLGPRRKPTGVGLLWSTSHLSITRYLVIVRLCSPLRIFWRGT